MSLSMKQEVLKRSCLDKIRIEMKKRRIEMKKARRRWNVFLIVLCMLFTMAPGTVFADQPVDPPIVDQLEDQQTGDQLPDVEDPNIPEDLEETPDDGLPADEGVPPDDGLPADEGVPPDSDQPADQEETANSGETSQDEVTPGGIEGPDDVTPPLEEDIPVPSILNTVFCTSHITINKIVNGAPEEDAVFTFQIKKLSGGSSQNVSITGENSTTVEVEPYQWYTVEEKNLPKNYELEDSNAKKNVYTNPNAEVTFTNRYVPPPTIKIEKIIDGDEPDPESPATFEFEILKFNSVKGKYQHYDYASIVGEGETDPVIVGTGIYKVVEEDDPNDDYTPVAKEITITVNKGTQAVFTFTNTYKDPTPAPTTGSITITKKIECEVRPETSETFTFTISKEGFTTTASISDEDNYEKTIRNLLPGDYTVTEVSIPENYRLDGENGQPAAVEAGEDFPITFINIYEPAITPTTGSITITKQISGDDPPVPGDTFSFTIRKGEYTTTASISNEDDYKKTIDNLPPGDYTVAEVSIPENYSLDGENGRTVSVAAGEDTPVTFANIYHDPSIDDPLVYVAKKVAEYDGVNLPAENSFDFTLTLDKLNSTVLYKIELRCNDVWEHANKLAGLKDIFNGTDITNDFLVLEEGRLIKAAQGEDDLGPIELIQEAWTTFYYLVTLPENGDYTNTISVFDLTEPEADPVIIASSSALVSVNFEDEDPEGPDDDDEEVDENDNGPSGGGSSHPRYYEVTYDPNYPSGAEASGAAPVDGKNYSYNNTVIVKGNTDDMKVGNYIFDNWNTKADGSGTTYLPGNSFYIRENVTLYAQWKLSAEGGTDTTIEQTNEMPTISNEVQDTGLDDVPKTGDDTPLLPMMLLGFLSIAAVLAFGGRKPEETEAKQ